MNGKISNTLEFKNHTDLLQFKDILLFLDCTSTSFSLSEKSGEREAIFLKVVTQLQIIGYNKNITLEMYKENAQ